MPRWAISPKDQASRLCSHFKAKSKACQVLPPTYMAALADQDNAYHSALEAKRKAAAKKRKLRSKKKRKSRQEEAQEQEKAQSESQALTATSHISG